MIILTLRQSLRALTLYRALNLVLFVRQHDRLVRRTPRYSLPGSTGAPAPRTDSLAGLVMRARGAQAKKVQS